MEFTVFLDADGVLNTRRTVTQTPKGYQEIEEFVILDDCKWDFDEYPKLRERLLLTDGIENATYASRTPAVEAMLFLDAIKKFA